MNDYVSEIFPKQRNPLPERHFHKSVYKLNEVFLILNPKDPLFQRLFHIFMNQYTKRDLDSLGRSNIPT